MNHMMVLHYNYSNRNRRWQQTNAPTSRAISMAMALHQCNTECIARCPMQHHQGFTGSHWTPPLGNYLLRIAQVAARAIINTTMMQHAPIFLAVLMVIAMWQYYTAHIAQWRRSVAFIKAIKRHHRASTRSDIIQSDTPTPVVLDIPS